MTIAGVKDPAGNTVATVTNSFTTGPSYDITAPTVVTIDPPNNATVGTNVIAKIVFNKPLNPITVNNSTFAMDLNDTGQWIPLTVTQSANGHGGYADAADCAAAQHRPIATTSATAATSQDQDGNNVLRGLVLLHHQRRRGSPPLRR